MTLRKWIDCPNCGDPVVQPDNGRRLRCVFCSSTRRAKLKAAWYVKNRVNNPKWRQENMRRAKEWRRQHPKQVKEYDKVRRPMLQAAE